MILLKTKKSCLCKKRTDLHFLGKTNPGLSGVRGIVYKDY